MSKAKTFQYFLDRLTRGFKSVKKREPNNLEKILINQEARQKAIDANKVINVDFGKPFKEEIESMSKKPKDPEKKAGGGRMGLSYLLAEDTNERMPLKSGGQAPEEIERPEYEGPYYETDEAEEALKEIARRYIEMKVAPAKVPISNNLQLMFDLNRMKIGGNKDFLGGEIDFGYNKNFGQGGESYGIGYRKSFAAGGIDKLRRLFLKMLGAGAATTAAVKSGMIGFGKKGATKKVAKEIIKTPNAPGKPEWFDSLVTRVINEGDDVTKKFATKDREIVHATKIDDDAMVTVYRDLDDGTVRVDIDDATTNVMGEQGDSVVSLQVKPGIADETTKGKKPPDEFEAVEADYRNYMDGPDDFTTETIDNVVSDTKDLTSDLTKVKMYAKGQKKPTIKEMMIQKDRAKTLKQAEENPAEYASDRGPDIDTKDYDYASGGIARMLGE